MMMSMKNWWKPEILGENPVKYHLYTTNLVLTDLGLNMVTAVRGRQITDSDMASGNPD